MASGDRIGRKFSNGEKHATIWWWDIERHINKDDSSLPLYTAIHWLNALCSMMRGLMIPFDKCMSEQCQGGHL